ncbi:DUF485 domain-containing protein [Streptomyces sp. TP-A0874]|uniref:DUF485 domain-containing protein n=1 Tax=Streptomyces sp. TP-A0874 TaxID=549819 RepID=UPI00085379C1|nr:DUF485 domain-containing protein [Streptomyces sp. TP-A0874]
MASASPPPQDSPDRAPESPSEAPSGADYREVQGSTEFAELRRAHRSFAFPLTVAFIAWYLLYVLLSSYAGDFMKIKVAGNLNMAFVLGLAQFVTTFLIAWWYSRHAEAELDPRAEAIKTRLESGA